MDAHYSMAHLELARVYEHREMYDAALAEFAKARELSRDSPESLASLAHCYAVSGRNDRGEKLLHELTEISERRYVSSLIWRSFMAVWSERKNALEWLNRAYEIRDGWMIYITVDREGKVCIATLDSAHCTPRRFTSSAIAVLGAGSPSPS